MEDKYYLKYLKYKQKYLELKNLHGGINPCIYQILIDKFEVIKINKDTFLRKIISFFNDVNNIDKYSNLKLKIGNPLGFPTDYNRIIENIKNVQSNKPNTFQQEISELTILLKKIEENKVKNTECEKQSVFFTNLLLLYNKLDLIPLYDFTEINNLLLELVELSQLYSEESAPNGNSSSYIPPSLESLTQKHNLLCEKFDIYREQIRIATKLYT